MRWGRWMMTAVLAAGLIGSGTACSGGENGSDELTAGEAQGGASGQGQDERKREPEANVLPANDNRPVAQRLRDVSIGANVKLKLGDEAKVDPNKINLLIQNGQVTMQGEVASPEERARAEAAAKGVKGVSQVVNQLAVAGQSTEAPPPSLIPPVTGAQKPAIAPQTAPSAASSRPQAQPSTAEARPAAPAPADPKPAKPAPAATYKVKSGDTLGAIARRNGTTVENLKRLNGLKNNNLRIGQTLRVK